MTGKTVAAIGLAAMTALAAAWASGGATQATTFNPFFGPPDFYRLDPPAPGANPDVRAQFNILPPSANFSPHFGGSITFEDAGLPPLFTGLFIGGPSIPNGAYVGRLDTVARLGLANEGCNSDVPIAFDLVEASTSTAARPFTNGGAMTLGVAVPEAPDDDLTNLLYNHPFDPLGLRQGTDGTAVEGTIQAAVNEIRIDSEDMLVVGVNSATNQYQVVRGWNGTTPAAHTAGAEITRLSVIYPNGPGTNLLANLGEDDGDLDNNGTVEHSELANQVADGADAVPSFVRDSLDPNVNADDGGYVQAHARYVGVAFVANTLITILQFVVMSPGALTAFPNLDWAHSLWGWASTTFLQDPLAPPSDSGITDFCAFKSNTFLYGTTHDNACTGASPPVACTGTGAGFTLRLAVDGGCPGVTTPNECGFSRLTIVSPLAQRLRFYQYAVSQRDYDNDGHENSLDICHSNANPTWDPRDFNASSGGDADGDGLPTACDPNDGQFNPDQDADGLDNRHDNCPTVHNTTPGVGGGVEPNTLQWDRDVTPGQDVPDGGPPSDDIGPACDIAANSCAGCPALTPTGPNGHYHAAYAAATVCIGAPTSDCSFTADNDGDGVVNATDTCINGTNPPTVFAGTTLTAPANAGDSTIIVGGSGVTVTVGSPIVINSPLETLRYVTSQVGNAVTFTPPLSFDHSVGDPVAQVAFAQSMRDLNDSGASDTGDIALLTGAFDKTGGNPALPGGFQARYDINAGVPTNSIDTADIAQLTSVFGRACGPPAPGGP